MVPIFSSDRKTVFFKWFLFFLSMMKNPKFFPFFLVSKLFFTYLYRSLSLLAKINIIFFTIQFRKYPYKEIFNDMFCFYDYIWIMFYHMLSNLMDTWTFFFSEINFLKVCIIWINIIQKIWCISQFYFILFNIYFYWIFLKRFFLLNDLMSSLRMTPEMCEKAQEIIEKIAKLPCATPFLEEVSPYFESTRLYYKKIKDPVDLSLIKMRNELKIFIQINDQKISICIRFPVWRISDSEKFSYI